MLEDRLTLLGDRRQVHLFVVGDQLVVDLRKALDLVVRQRDAQ
jgi:hypothetical protein